MFWNVTSPVNNCPHSPYLSICSDSAEPSHTTALDFSKPPVLLPVVWRSSKRSPPLYACVYVHVRSLLCKMRGVCHSLLHRIKKKKCTTLYSASSDTHIQTALLNRFLANTSCVDRRDELLFLLQLAEGTELGRRSKRAATVVATKPAGLLLLPLPVHTNTHKHTYTVMHGCIKGSWTSAVLFEQVIPINILWSYWLQSF